MSAINPYDEFHKLARQMYADARARFREMAEPLLVDAQTREFAKSLELAIGEVSPEEAIGGLLRWMAETGRQP
jgi:hypothetical protein